MINYVRGIKMFRSIIIFILSFVMSFNILAIGNKDYYNDIKSYIGKSIKQIEKDVQKLHEEKKIKIISEDKTTISDIFIKDRGISVDGINVGDPLEVVYAIYPKDWIYEDEKGCIILKGKGTHYGIATQYIFFLSENKKDISEIQLGYTSNFTDQRLPQSNIEAKNLLQGKWESQYGRIIEFNENTIKDNQFDKMYSNQQYIILSPNEMIIYRNGLEKNDKMKLKFWISEEELYIFSINQLGLPIRDTVEKFNRVIK